VVVLFAVLLLGGGPVAAQEKKDVPDQKAMPNQNGKGAPAAYGKKAPAGTAGVPEPSEGPRDLFRVESEESFRQRIRRESPDPKAVRFPEEPSVPRHLFAGRSWPHQTAIVEPCFTCYGRLLFEQINAERYGWDLGFIHPLVSLGVFWFDFATLPYHLATAPCRCYECDAGYCLPGDPVPLLLYPPEFSVPGTLAEAATVGMLFLLFP
jgi:hypothetical protein